MVGHSCIDFVRVDTSKDYRDQDGENWSDQETLLLLEAMELYNENWVQIADHVGSKSKAQCILHFLRLPVEDGLLDNVELPGVTDPANPTNGYDHRGGASDGALPGDSVYFVSNCKLLAVIMFFDMPFSLSTYFCRNF